MSATATPRLRPGDQAPELDLTATDGRRVRLADLRGGPTIVYFFPKAFTAGCTAEACEADGVVRSKYQFDPIGHVPALLLDLKV